MREASWCCGSAAQANKNKDRFEQKFKELVDEIRTELDAASVTPRSGRKEQPELTLAGTK